MRSPRGRLAIHGGGRRSHWEPATHPPFSPVLRSNSPGRSPPSGGCTDSTHPPASRPADDRTIARESCSRLAQKGRSRQVVSSRRQTRTTNSACQAWNAQNAKFLVKTAQRRRRNAICSPTLAHSALLGGSLRSLVDAGQAGGRKKTRALERARVS